MDEQVSPLPDDAAALMTKEHGVWVCRVGEALSVSATEELIREIRDERDLNNLGRETFKS